MAFLRVDDVGDAPSSKLYICPTTSIRIDGPELRAPSRRLGVSAGFLGLNRTSGDCCLSFQGLATAPLSRGPFFRDFSMSSLFPPYPRKPSKKLTPADAAVIKPRLLGGEFCNRIAADFDVNPGRISEIKTGKLFPEVPWVPSK